MSVQPQQHHLAVDAVTDLAGADLREGRIALQDKLDGFSILRHEHRPGELNFAVLSGANLAGVQMTGAVAMTSDFTDANLSGAVMVGAKLMRAVMDGADLSHADLGGADLSGASLRRAVLNGVNLSLARLENTDMTDVLRAPPPITFVDRKSISDVMSDHEAYCDTGGRRGSVTILSGVDFRPMKTLKKRRLSGLNSPRSVFFGMDMEGCELQGGDFSACDFRGANLRDADLRGARFAGAQMARCDLRGARMGPLKLDRERFVRTDFSGASLRGAHAPLARFLGAEMDGARIAGCDLTGAVLST